jgi:type II secretory pathway pseudopilin PulG
MRHASSTNQPVKQSSSPRTFLHTASILIVLLLATSVWGMQTKPAGQTKRPSSAAAPKATAPKAKSDDEDWQKYSGVLAELFTMQQKFQKELQFPALRSQSRLLPLLPESTLGVAAFPNYGDVLHQATKLFQKEREENATLRTWWKNDVGDQGKKVDDALEKLYQVSQFLGDEIIVSGSASKNVKDKDPNVLLLAEIKKPGLKEFLQQMDKELSGKEKPSLHILDPAELAGATEKRGEPVVLVRPDFLVVAFDVASLRACNSQLDKNAGNFASTPFGQRITQAYHAGAGVVFGLDLEKIVREAQQGKTAKDMKEFQRTGFGDVKYLVWEHKDVSSQSTSEIELTFNGPRRGVASWLANPAQLGGLDFVSPKAAVVFGLVLKNPGEMFEDIREIASASNPDALAPLVMAEGQLQVNIKQDLLSKLAGETIIDVENTTGSQPDWRLVFRVNDPAGLQQTLARILDSVPMNATQHEEGGLTYRSLVVPSGPKPMEISYAFVDGYLVIAPGHEALMESYQLHRNGGSLAKSADFRSSVPPGHSPEASGVIYQNLGPLMESAMKQMPPGMDKMFSQFYGGGKPAAFWVYGDNSSIRLSHSNAGIDYGMALIGAAIAIPNLIRAKTSANESAATASLRTVNTAQVTYATAYRSKGYARNLAALGPGDGDCSDAKVTAAHACLLDDKLGCSGTWCTKSGFRFRVTGTCTALTCANYVAVATPVDENTGGKSFCSTSDGVIRTHTGPPLAAPVTAAECRKWSPLQ